MRYAVVALLALLIAACSSDGGSSVVDDNTAQPDSGDLGVDGAGDGVDVAQTMDCGTLHLVASALRPGVEVTGSVNGATLTAPTSQTCAEAAGPEAVFFVDVERTVDLIWEVTPDFDGVAYIRYDCDGLSENVTPIEELSCSDTEPGLGFESAVLLNATPGRYFLFVDGFAPADVGMFSALLRLREVVSEGGACDPEVVLSRCEPGFGCDAESLTCSRERACEDHADNDGDGLIDCEDPDDCQTSAVCTPGAGAVGSACASSSDCAAATAPFCWSEREEGYPGGSCSEFCSLQSADCSVGGVCLDVRLPSGQGLCFLPCDPDAGCDREGYECTVTGAGLLCLPACTDDSQCGATGFCDEDTGDCAVETEDCADGADNDGDQRIDCEELDCSDNSDCTSAHAEACADPSALTTSAVGDTSEGSQLFSGSCTGVGGAYEDIYELDTDELNPEGDDGFLLLELSSTTDHGMYVRRVCDAADSQLGCVDRLAQDATEGLAVPVEAGESLYIFVDGFNSPTEAGPYSLAAEFVALAESEPNDDPTEPSEWTEPFAAQISPAGDVDWVAVSVDRPGSPITARVGGLTNQCDTALIDPEVEIVDGDGETSLAFNDDRNTRNVCATAVARDLGAGEYFVRVSSSREFAPYATFAYELTIEVSN